MIRSLDGSVGLDAVWTPCFDFVLDNGAIFDDGEAGAKHILRTDLDKPPTAIRDGWTFLGWYDDVVKQYVDLEYALALDEYRSFRAMFIPNITFDGNGGKVMANEAGYDTYTIGLSALVKEYGRFFDAELEGKTFIGWLSSDTSDLTKFENILNRTEPMTLVASWDVGVIFQMSSGAVWSDGSSGNRTYPAREVGEWEELPTVYLDGYTFVEWQDGSGRPVTPAGLSAFESSVVIHPLFKAEVGPDRGINITVENYTEPTGAVWAEPTGGWVAGANTFTASCGSACAVTRVRDGEFTVQSCEQREGDTYAFTTELTDGDKIVIVLVGDVNLDGKLTLADLAHLSQYHGGKYTPQWMITEPAP